MGFVVQFAGLAPSSRRWSLNRLATLMGGWAPCWPMFSARPSAVAADRPSLAGPGLPRARGGGARFGAGIGSWEHKPRPAVAGVLPDQIRAGPECAVAPHRRRTPGDPCGEVLQGRGRAFQLPSRAGEVALAGRVDAEVPIGQGM